MSVSGVVTVDGEPLKNVTFFATAIRTGDATETPPMLAGVTDDEGRYALFEARYPARKGGRPGTYVISWQMVSDPDFVSTGDENEQEPPAVYPVPKKYRKIDFVIPESGTDSADLVLTTD
ncbi:MAG: hypothetical protein AAF532_17100 [Planctomycetota bacterium]